MERKRKFARRPGDKTERLEIRLTENEMTQLNTIVEKTGQSKTEVIREGIRMKYNLSRFDIDLD